MWALENGIIYAAVYDTIDDRYIGDVEIKAWGGIVMDKYIGSYNIEDIGEA